MIGQLDQRARGQNVDVAGCPGGFRPAVERADQAMAAGIGSHRRRQHARHWRDRAIQRQFAQDGIARQRVGGDRANRRHDAKRDRQIIMAPLLGHVGWGEIDGDALGGQGQPRGGEGRAHPLARFRHRLVAKPNHQKQHGAAGNLHLHIDGPRLNALKRNRGDTHDHFPPPHIDFVRLAKVAAGCKNIQRTAVEYFWRRDFCKAKEWLG